MKHTIKKHIAGQEQGHELLLVSLELVCNFENVGKDDADKAIEGTKIRRKLPIFA